MPEGIRLLTRADGVPNAGLNKIYEASDGFLWLSTQSGLYRYDGYSFAGFYADSRDTTTLSSGSVTDIEEDAAANLWVGTFGKGLCRYQPAYRSWKQYLHPTPDSNSFYWIFDLFRDARGRLWAGTNGRGLLLYKGETDSFVQFIPEPGRNTNGTVRFENEVRRIAADVADPDVLWLATTDGLFRFDTRTAAFQKYQNKKNGVARWIDNSFHYVYADSSGFIWLGAWGGGVVRFDKATAGFLNIPFAPFEYQRSNLSKNIVSHIVPAGKDDLYVSTLDDGVWLLNTRTLQCRRFLPVDSTDTGPRSFSGITNTSDGCTWFCSANGIHFRHPLNARMGTRYRLFQPPGFSYRPDLLSVLYDSVRREYWMSCNAGYGIYVYDESMQYRQSIPVDGQRNDRTFRELVQDGAGNVFLLSLDQKGLYQYSKQRNRFSKSNLLPGDSMFYSIAADRLGDLWMVVRSGLIRRSRATGTLRFYRFPESVRLRLTNTSQRPGLVFDRNNQLWMYYSGGLVQLDPARETWQHITTREGLASDYINAVTVAPNGHLWLAPADEGLQVYDPAGKKFIRHLLRASGFLFQRINFLASDATGFIWATTINGLLRIHPSGNSWNLYDMEDGLESDYLDQGVFCTASDRVFLAQSDGFFTWKASGFSSLQGAPALYFSQIKAADRELPLGPAVLNLPHDQNDVQFYFGAIAPVINKRLRFFYRLLPGQQEWIQVDTRNILLAGLSPGTYTLQLKALGPDEVVSKVLEQQIRIRYPFWWQAWFLVLVAAGLVLAVYGLYRYRIRQLVRVQELRNSISRDLHDEIGSAVSSVNMLTEVVRRKLGAEHEALPVLEQISVSAQEAGESIDETVWSVNPVHDAAEDVFIRIRKFVAERLEAQQTGYHILIPDPPAGLRLPMQLRRDLWLVCKEAVNNICKHAHPAMVEVEFRVVHRRLLVRIEDDGRGFDAGGIDQKKRNGIRSMRDRMGKYKGGEFELDSRPGKGTRLTITFPLRP